ncbi:MAG: amidohydrolase family protein [Gammaproteobacteria bacterium]|nr:amidohydrolase family protein [Gammaproteobacteria bacterium]
MSIATHRLILVIVALLGAEVSFAETTAFVNVNVVPMLTDTVIAAQTVLVEDGLISEIGSVDEIRIPKGAKAIDGTDRYLLPGLAEMHAHVPAADSRNLDRDFSLFVAHGITTIRGMLGQPSHLALREQLLDGEIFGPRLITSGPSLNGRSVRGAPDARRQVREQAAAGYDFIKVHPGLSADEFTAIAETANELGMPFAGHVPVAVGVRAALELNIAAIDHLDGYLVALLPPHSFESGGYGGFFDIMLAAELDPQQIGAIAAATAASGTWNVPTQILIEQRVSATPVTELRNHDEMRYMPAETVEHWATTKQALLSERDFDPAVAELAINLRRQLILALHEAGARLLLGSDAPQVFNVPGYSTHRELKVLVASGLTAFEALQTGTTAAAEFLGTNAGSVQVGKDADLVLLDANPLDDIENSRRIHGVMLRGLWLSGYTLQQRLEKYRRD